jgi:nucleotide-binding universal stress UspA family protein
MPIDPSHEPIARTADAPVDRTAPLVPEPSLGTRLRHGKIVVAVDGGAEGVAPVLVAEALQRRFAASVSAVQVMDMSAAPLPAPLPSLFTLARDLIGDAPYADDVRARRRQFSDWIGTANDWPVHVALGTPASEILRYAEREQAALIVVGLRRHGIADRVLRDETTLMVARRARGVVMGVVPSLLGLPRLAVVAVDFGPASIRAARAALDVLAPPTPAQPSSLRLVYVDRAGSGVRERSEGEAVVEQLGVAAAFEQLAAELTVPPGVTVESVVRRGTPAEELLSYVEAVNADLLAVGSLRHERVERWLLGSVTTEVIRDGRCSVLVIPPVQLS